MKIRNAIALTITLFLLSFSAFPKEIPLRESSIFLPTYDNKGNSLQSTHNWLKTKLNRQWLGYTSTRAKGGWISPSGKLMEDDTIVYTVAMQCTNIQLAKLTQIVLELKKQANQKAIYTRDCTGRVRIL